MSLDTWQKIDRLDLEAIKAKLKSKKGWWWNLRTDLDAVEQEYKQFLYLIATNPGEVVVPWNDKLDDLWHEHILDTARYEKDCQDIFGKFIHHNPHLAVGTRPQVQAYEKTKGMYRTAFKDKAASRSSTDPGCGTFMPIVFCGGGDFGHTHSGHSHSSHTHSDDAGHSDTGGHGDSGGASCGGGSSCGSSCGGGGCGGGGD